jgi:c-di-GMP-binding flagellar brake protein YcgR
MSDTAQPLPKNALYRSHIEICRILQELADKHTSIFAPAGSAGTFVSRVLFVDPNKGFFDVAYCANKQLNSIVLKSPSLMFSANHQDAHLVFEVTAPAETLIDGQSAIRFALPDVLTLYHRREFPRIPVPAEASLRCIADEGGFMSFESHICDISHDGLGGIIYDREIRLEPGTVLKGCRVIIPGGKAIIVDLMLRHITAITLPDGSIANRAGFRFIQRPDEITDLIGYFIKDLDKN